MTQAKLEQSTSRTTIRAVSGDETIIFSSASSKIEWAMNLELADEARRLIVAYSLRDENQ